LFSSGRFEKLLGLKMKLPVTGVVVVTHLVPAALLL
jgi:hypothetical protein